MFSAEKVHHLLATKASPILRTHWSIKEATLKALYLTTAMVVTFGWLWLLAWCAMQMV
jgi:phosphopantetheinyl transferase (holo-ACP synthase)